MINRSFSNAARKEEIRRRLNIARYSNPADIVYSDDNDHNPLVLEPCSACQGTGKICRPDGGTHVTEACESCAGSRTTGRVISLYGDDNSEVIETKVSEAGWIKCPRCEVSFKVTDRERWSGVRHRTCGQKLKFSGANDSGVGSV